MGSLLSPDGIISQQREKRNVLLSHFNDSYEACLDRRPILVYPNKRAIAGREISTVSTFVGRDVEDRSIALFCSAAFCSDELPSDGGDMPVNWTGGNEVTGFIPKVRCCRKFLTGHFFAFRRAALGYDPKLRKVHQRCERCSLLQEAALCGVSTVPQSTLIVRNFFTQLVASYNTLHRSGLCPHALATSVYPLQQMNHPVIHCFFTLNYRISYFFDKAKSRPAPYIFIL